MVVVVAGGSVGRRGIVASLFYVSKRAQASLDVTPSCHNKQPYCFRNFIKITRARPLSTLYSLTSCVLLMLGLTLWATQQLRNLSRRLRMELLLLLCLDESSKRRG